MVKEVGLIVAKLLCIIIVLSLLFTGCGTDIGIGDEPVNPPEDTACETTIDSDNEITPPNVVQEEPIDDIPIRELTEEEKSLLSFEADKIIIIVGLTGGIANDLSFLQEKYPDIKFISVEYEHNNREYPRNEIWYSETTGFSYQLYFTIQGSYSDPDTPRINEIHFLRGEISSLINGLPAAVKTSELLEAIGIPESDWAVGDPPKDPANFYMYDGGHYYSDPPSSSPHRTSGSGQDDILIVVPDAADPAKRFPNIIKITPKRPGFISPTDKFEITSALVGA